MFTPLVVLPLEVSVYNCIRRAQVAMDHSERSSAKPSSKKRKPTYLVRKEEVQALEEKAQALRKELEALQQVKKNANVQLTAAKNEIMRELLLKQHLAVASAHTMIFHHLSNQRNNPMKTYIHLPKQWAARRSTLVAMKDDKFRQCHAYLAARSCSLDMTKDHFSGDEYEDIDGNCICHRFDVTHLRGVKSLKQVYDALVYFMFNMEIRISETLGDITVREDYDSIEDGACISNHRLVSNHDSVISEVNTATFAQYINGPNQFESSSCAMLVTDNIDEDDLHPYNSSEFVRRDVSAAVVLTEERRRRLIEDNGGDESEEEEVVVVMRRAAFTKIYNPNFDVSESALLDMSERITQWPKVMMQTIREVIDAQSS